MGMDRRTFVCGSGAACLAGVALWLGLESAGGEATSAADPNASLGPDGNGLDWDSLRGQYPEIVAWMRVGGTPIDLPVCQPSGGEDADFYLRHGADREPSGDGCPYLDDRANANGTHGMVYGHHMGDTDRVFSPIYRAYEQDSFDGIGDLTWSTPAMGDTLMQPVMSMSVDSRYATVQRFGFESEAAMRDWLGTLLGDASAAAADAHERIALATRAMTLVTCSSTTSGQRWRTLLTFVA